MLSTPRITVAAAPACGGAPVTVVGSGFALGEQVTIALNGAAVATTPSVVTAGADGAFTATFQASDSFVDGSNAVSAIGATSRVPALATLQCALPVAARFYFAGGQETNSVHLSLAVLNPDHHRATVRVTIYTTAGRVFHETLLVPATTQQTVRLDGFAPVHGDFGLSLTADAHVAAQLLLDRPGRDGDSILGNTSLGTRWYLAEGYTNLTFHETIALLNPGRRTARVTLLLRPFALHEHLHGGARTVVVAVAPHSERVVDINPLRPMRSLSVLATSDRAIVVERSLRFSLHGRGGDYGLTARAGTNVAATSWLLAEGSTLNGFETFLTILNPNERPARVTARFYKGSGGVIGQRTIVMAPLSRANIRLNDVVRASGVASTLSSDAPIVVERPEYFGSPNAARIAGADVFGRNGVAPRWSFPGGETGGLREFLLFYNPSAAAIPVNVTLYGSDGRVRTRRVTLPAGQRFTLDVGQTFRGLATDHGLTVQSLDGQGFVAEQSVFAPDHTTLYSTQGLAQ